MPRKERSQILLNPKNKIKEEEQNKRICPLQEEKQILSLQLNIYKISFFSTFFFFSPQPNGPLASIWDELKNSAYLHF